MKFAIYPKLLNMSLFGKKKAAHRMEAAFFLNGLKLRFSSTFGLYIFKFSISNWGAKGCW
jgi:hypothetical protein